MKSGLWGKKKIEKKLEKPVKICIENKDKKIGGKEYLQHKDYYFPAVFR